jgi:hypothetical protein
VVLLLALTTTEGCHVDKTGGSDDACGPQSLDLRHPPSRSELGFAQATSTATRACDAGFALHVALPHDVSIDVDTRRTVADSMRAADPTTGQPTTLSISSTFADVTTTAARALDLAATLDMPSSEITAWRHTATAAAGSSDNTTTSFIRSKLGYATAELQVVRLGVSDDCYLSLTLSWGH